MKKIVSMALILVFTLALCVPAFAGYDRHRWNDDYDYRYGHHDRDYDYRYNHNNGYYNTKCDYCGSYHCDNDCYRYSSRCDYCGSRYCDNDCFWYTNRCDYCGDAYCKNDCWYYTRSWYQDKYTRNHDQGYWRRHDGFYNSSAYTVTASTLNVRKGAGVKYSRVGYLSKGDRVSVVSIRDGWAKIAWEGGYAYVSARYIR